MSKLVDFKCDYGQFVGITPEYATSLGLKIPDLHKNGEDLVKISLALKKEGNSEICQIPFDTVAQGENVGADIKYDDSPLGPRKKTELLEKTEGFLELSPLNPKKGRITEILRSCTLLREQNEEPVVTVRGVFDILNSLIDIQKVLMDFAMNPKIMEEVCGKIKKDIVTYCVAIEKAGGRIIFYSDASGSLSLLGPKFAKKLVKNLIYPLMKELDDVLDKKTVIAMCPKTAFMLVGCDKAKWVTKDVDINKKYFEAYLEDDDVRFVGNKCRNDIGQASGGKLQYLEII